MLGGAFEPLFRLRLLAGQRIIGPVAALVLGGRVDHAGNVAGGAQDETVGLGFVWIEDGQRSEGRIPRHDMVLARAVDEGWHINAAQVDPGAGHAQLARGFQAVFQVGIAQIPAKHRSRQVGAVRVPVQQVKRRRLVTLQVVRLHVIPHQVVRAQAGESAGQVAPRHQAAGFQALFAHGHLRLVDKHIQHAGVAEIEEGGQQRQAGGRLFAARRQHRQGGRDDGTANAKAQQVQLLLAADVLHRVDGLDHAFIDIIVPAGLGQRLVRIAPRDQEHGIALLHRIAHQRVFRL